MFSVKVDRDSLICIFSIVISGQSENKQNSLGNFSNFAEIFPHKKRGGYGHYSCQLMAAFLRVNEFSDDLSKMVKARKPFRQGKVVSLIREKEGLQLWITVSATRWMA